MASRLREHYDNVVKGELQKQFDYKNPMQVPKVKKIIVNMGVGEATGDSKVISAAVADMTAITGRKPIVIRAKRSVSVFKLREDMPIGCKVTLRREQMYDFLDRLITIALPRVRDFRGVSEKSFDGRGNYALGLTEQIVFPEVDYDKIDTIRGMDIVIVTSAKTDEEVKALLAGFEMPFPGRSGDSTDKTSD